MTANQHLTEDELILHHYRELEHGADAEGHLETCGTCRTHLHDLERLLEAASPDAVPDRGADYGSRVFARLSPRLRRRAARPLPQHLAAWGALAASLVLAFWLGRQFPADPVTAPTPVVRERVLLVAVGDHLERSRMVLAELVNAHGEGPADIRSEQRWAGELVGEGRLYRQAAVRTGDTSLATLLDELERVLVQVSNGPSDLTAGELRDLQDRIEARGILFKVRVVEGQVRAKAKAATREEIGS